MHSGRWQWGCSHRRRAGPAGWRDAPVGGRLVGNGGFRPCGAGAEPPAKRGARVSTQARDTGSGTRSPGRAPIRARTLRRDRWWAYPAATFVVLALRDLRGTGEPRLLRRSLPLTVRLAVPVHPLRSGARLARGAACGLVRQLVDRHSSGDRPDLSAGSPADLLLLPQGVLPLLVGGPARVRGARAAPPLQRRDLFPAASAEHPPVLLLRRPRLQRHPHLGRGHRFRLPRAAGHGTGEPGSGRQRRPAVATPFPATHAGMWWAGG